MNELPITGLGAALLGTLAVLAWRIRETRRAVTTRSILIPPIGMSTGFSMFMAPAFRVPLLWGVGAFAAGAVLLAYPLLASSRLTREGNAIMIKRSNSFMAVLLGLAALRFGLRSYVGAFMSAPQTAGLFFILAFGMILRWRTWMLLEYRRLTEAGVRS